MTYQTMGINAEFVNTEQVKPRVTSKKSNTKASQF